MYILGYIITLIKFTIISISVTIYMMIIMKFGMPTLVTFDNIEENVIFAKKII